MRQVRRRQFLLAVGACGLSVSLSAFGQQPGKIWRVGYLALTFGPDDADVAFREQLRVLGYVEGQNLSLVYRWATGKEEQVPAMAEELVRLKVDVIVTRTTFVAKAAKAATSTIPIVMASAANPVATGVVASLARPGGNVTGETQDTTEIDGKRLELLRKIVPKATRLAALVWGKSPVKPLFLEQIRTAARQMGITLVLQEVDTPEAIASAFRVMRSERVQGLIVQTGPFFTNNRRQIVDLAVQNRLPTIFEARAMVEAGGLISYGASNIEMLRRAAKYVDRILKGAKPADLPVEQPTKFEMVINLKTAKALGIAIPQSVLLQADEVIK